jgi:putative molybdopterin biosynthesis protein
VIEVRFDHQFVLQGGAGEPVDMRLLGLLRGIADGGSLKLAASGMGLSYRHAWAMLEKWQDRFGQPLVVGERGRGARLAPLGEKLLWADSHVRGEAVEPLAELARRLQGELGESFAQAPARLIVRASHDIALGTLREFVRQELGLDLDLQFQGSADSLASLARGKAQLAGFHLGSAKDGRMLAEYRRLLQPRFRLISFVTRQQGLMFAAGNPKGISSIRDLARKDLRLVNRQRGSGTRMELDRMLEEIGVSPSTVKGYDLEELTHLAVAAMIATGVADVGLGIRAAAEQYRLNFIPLLREPYYFACRANLLEEQAMQDLLAVLRTSAFRQIISRLPGYDAGEAGQIKGVDEVLATFAPINAT